LVFQPRIELLGDLGALCAGWDGALQHDTQRGRDLGNVLLAFGCRVSSPMNWRQLNFKWHSAGRCFSTRIGMSGS
jgi:hypothetical protein